MNRRIRQIMLGVAIVIFSVVTPLIVLYALGFRFTREQVGAITIESQPSRVEVYRDTLRAGTTPQTLTGVGNSITRISLRLPGYRTWEKLLPFSTGATSAVRAILIPEKIQTATLQENISRFVLAPNRNVIAMVNAEPALTISDETGQVIIPAKALPARPTNLLWSPDSTFLAISYANNRHDIFSLSDSTLHQLPAFKSLAPDSLAWDIRVPGRLLALLSDNTLKAFTIDEETPELLASQVISFAVETRDIFVIAGQTLQEITSRGLAVNSTDISLPKPAKKVLVGSDGNIAIWFTDGSVALRDGQNFKEIATNVSSVEFSPNGALLYFQTASQELMAYNVSDERLMQIPLGRAYLVTRISQPITHPQWFAGSQHLLYQVGDQVVLTEIDTRDHAVSEVIDSTNMSNAQLAVGEEGSSLFYLKRVPNGTTSLVRADLIAK